MTRFLGIDLGASSLKACLVDAGGTRLALVRAALTTRHPAPGQTEQDPAAWRTALNQAIADLGQSHAADMAALDGIAFSGGAHIGVLTDSDGTPLRPAIMWSDQRAAKEAAKLAADGIVERVTGNRKAFFRQRLAGLSADRRSYERHNRGGGQSNGRTKRWLARGFAENERAVAAGFSNACRA